MGREQSELSTKLQPSSPEAVHHLRQVVRTGRLMFDRLDPTGVFSFVLFRFGNPVLVSIWSKELLDLAGHPKPRVTGNNHECVQITTAERSVQVPIKSTYLVERFSIGSVEIDENGNVFRNRAEKRALESMDDDWLSRVGQSRAFRPPHFQVSPTYHRRSGLAVITFSDPAQDQGVIIDTYEYPPKMVPNRQRI